MSDDLKEYMLEMKELNNKIVKHLEDYTVGVSIPVLVRLLSELIVAGYRHDNIDRTDMVCGQIAEVVSESLVGDLPE